MEKRDKRLIADLIKGNKTLRDYVEQHNEYERQLEEYNKIVYLTPEESMERKRIQKLKLAGRDEIDRILAEHRRRQKIQKA
jgi:uncharacterized protein YdcH (DUF465 family)